ncbi:hypothetical protein KC316_g21367, partial [Hortaea werneckii]
MESDDGTLSTFCNLKTVYQPGVVFNGLPPLDSQPIRGLPSKPSNQANTRSADMDDFVVEDDDGEEQKPKRSKQKTSNSTSGKSSTKPPSPPSLPVEESEEIPTTSTARQWTYDPEAPPPTEPRKVADMQKKKQEQDAATGKKQKAHTTDPSERYPWLATVLDADRHPPDHPDYDPRTLYIPPMAWGKFSPFEKQYWEIKCKFWNTIVFFKKGKFYELYENDATVGHQLFDLKLTDRVNM